MVNLNWPLTGNCYPSIRGMGEILSLLFRIPGRSSEILGAISQGRWNCGPEHDTRSTFQGCRMEGCVFY